MTGRRPGRRPGARLRRQRRGLPPRRGAARDPGRVLRGRGPRTGSPRRQRASELCVGRNEGGRGALKQRGEGDSQTDGPDDSQSDRQD